VPTISVDNSTLELIGNTPLIDISFLSPNKYVKIFAKLESQNPSGSYKDRIALAMIEKAEKEKKIKKGDIIIEPTSGNTGISLAMISKIKRYKFIAVMPESMSEERKNIIKSFGGELVLVKSEAEAIEKAGRIAKEKNYFMPNQFENLANVEAAEAMAKEINNQIDNIDVFIAGMGTGGTITGASRILKEKNNKTKIIGFYSNEDIQGTINIEKFKPRILDLSLVNRLVKENKNRAVKNMKLLWENGVFVGMSSGAALGLALNEARRLKTGNIVIMFTDSGNRYLSLIKEKEIKRGAD